MSFPIGTIVDEKILFQQLPNDTIAPIRPTNNDLWGKDGGSFFYNGIVKTDCPSGLVWNSATKICTGKNPTPKPPTPKPPTPNPPTPKPSTPKPPTPKPPTPKTPTSKPVTGKSQRGAVVRYDDLKKLPMSAFVTSKTNLDCKTMPKCIFGVYTLEGKKVMVQLSTHLGGAVYRLTYDGVDFVLPVAIVGASMQTAMSFDIRPQLGMTNEQYNPTEGGTSTDSFTGRSSSKILELRANDNAVYTRSIPAYFRPPGYLLIDKRTGKRTLPAVNKTVLSEVEFSKRIEFIDDTTLEYTINLNIPKGHYFSQVEALACWVPTAASEQRSVLQNDGWKTPKNKEIFWVKSGKTRTYGIINATASGKHAWGVVLTDWPKTVENGPPLDSPRYTFEGESKTWRKINIVQRLGSRTNFSTPIPEGVYGWTFRFYFGTMQSVRSKLEKLINI